MAEVDARLAEVPALLADAAKRFRVPGAALAVLDGDAPFESATGVVNARTGVEATTDSVFEIGSITKVWTTSLVMQLVEEGRVELDAPVRRYLPELALADRAAAEAITVRMLLTHTSGIEGDFFQPAGRGDDAVERYVLACAALPQLHPPGRLWSYCNSGFVLAGRIVEKLRGCSWDEALRRHLLAPLGTEGMGTFPEEALRFRAAVGHFLHPKTGDVVMAPLWPEPRASGPAGATPFAFARDLCRFARMHLDGGVAQGGQRVLAEASVRAMQERQVALPVGQLASAWGLGWMLFDWSGRRVIGHDGGTSGQFAFLRVVPERRVAVALLTNGGDAAGLYREVFGHVLGALCGIALPPLPEANPALVTDLSRFVGRYERLAASLDVALEDGRLVARQRWKRPPFPVPDPPPFPLELVDERTLLMRLPPAGTPAAVSCLELDAAGRPGYLLAGRLHRRV